MDPTNDGSDGHTLVGEPNAAAGGGLLRMTGAIVGARDAAQVDGWIEASTLQFSAEDLGEIVRALEKIGAGSGLVEPSVFAANAATGGRS